MGISLLDQLEAWPQVPNARTPELTVVAYRHFHTLTTLLIQMNMCEKLTKK